VSAKLRQEGEAQRPEPLRVTAIMPCYNGMGFLQRSLPPLLAMLGQDLLEVIVVDDGSSDGSGAYAAGEGARVMTTGGREGPGAARNLAAREAQGDVLLFVDADVVIHADALGYVQSALADPGVVAVFGSYDNQPPDAAFASQYMNLRHHFVHHQHAGEADTFWAGCGAVRRQAFLAVGGYDCVTYERPSIEDIELGYRLRAAGGRIALVPPMQGTHLKQWTLWGVVHTDIVCRALPWSRLLLSTPHANAALNTRGGERAKAALAACFWLALLLALVGAVDAWVPLLLFCAALYTNRQLFALFRRRRGWIFGLAGVLFHQLYYVYSTAAFVYAWLESRLHPQRTSGGSAA